MSLVRLGRGDGGDDAAAAATTAAATQGIAAHHLRRASRLLDVLDRKSSDAEQQSPLG